MSGEGGGEQQPDAIGNASGEEAPSVDFEQALEELETLVERMETGELSLDESLAAFERGIRLTRRCQQALESAEQRVQQLIEEADGSLDARPESAAGDASEDEGET